jgi:hypothetical protein
MSHTIELSDRAHEIRWALARQRGQSLAELLEALATQPTADRDPMMDPRHETFEECFLGLGMSSDDIKTAQEIAESDAEV